MNRSSENIIPQALEAERAVLGSLMLSPEKQFVADLSENSFYEPRHKQVFQSIEHLYGQSSAVDVLTVTNHLKPIMEDAAYFVSQLTNQVVSNVNTKFHIAILRQMEIKREMIVISQDILARCYDEKNDPFELLNEFSLRLSNLSSILLKKQTRTAQAAILDSIKEMEQIGDGDLIGISSGFKLLDMKTLGWENGNLYILAARPGMGKTALAMQFALNAAKQDKKVLFISAEMPDKQLGKRIKSSETGIDLYNIRQNRLTDSDWSQIMSTVNEHFLTNLYINDQSSPSLLQLRAAAQNMKSLDMIVVDYLQLMKGQGKNREGEIGMISRGLKQIAKDFNVPVIALSQLNREVEKRSDKRPMLADLRESGSIEQDADVVMFVYRDSVYSNELESPAIEEAEIIISKDRHGNLGSIILDFDGSHVRFMDKKY